MDNSPDKTMLVSAGFLAALLLAGGFVSYSSTRRLQQDAALVSHTLEVLELSGDLLRRMGDAQMAMRGFVITGDEAFLAPYSEALATLDSVMDQLKQKTADNFPQQERLRQLVERKAAALADIREAIRLRRQDPTAAQVFIASRKPKDQLDTVRTLVGAFEREERDLLKLREQQSATTYQIAVAVVIVHVAVALAGVGVFVWMIRRRERTRLNTAAVLERQAAELRDNQERLGGLVQSVMDAVISIDSEQRILVFNPAAERMFGYSSAEMLGQSIELLIPKRFRPAHQEHVRRFGETGVTTRQMGHLGAISGLRADGKEFPIEASISQMQVQGQKIFTVILRDISERKKAEGELHEAIEDLTRLNQELEQFAYVASHDLQEPLRAISGCVQILQKRYKDRLDAGAEELIGHAVEGASRMQTLISDLLTYSRITTRGKEPAQASSATALQLALANLEVAVKESGALITADELPVVRADATQLTQVFQNLIGNAIKFAREKPPTIHIGARREGASWVFSVKDNGIGIAPEYFERIFGVFQRLHTRNEYPGTGIGLSLCKKIVERHGGRIWVESMPNRGSTFFFTLPEKGAAP